MITLNMNSVNRPVIENSTLTPALTGAISNVPPTEILLIPRDRNAKNWVTGVELSTDPEKDSGYKE